MILKEIKELKDDTINASLVLILLSPIFIKDFKITRNGILFSLKSKISEIKPLIEALLTALNDLTEEQFYFEEITCNEVILKQYSLKSLNFSEELIFTEPSWDMTNDNDARRDKHL